MNKTNKKPLLPTISVEEFLAIDPKNPETLTSSPIVNAVADAFLSVHPVVGDKIAKYLDVDQRKLSNALELITGHSFASLRFCWLERRLEETKANHPDWNSDQVAHALGFGDRSSLFRFLATKKYKNAQKKNISTN